MDDWSTEREELLKRLWDEPISLEEIGRQLNPLSPVPKSTLSQKARRMQLGKRKHSQATHWRKNLQPAGSPEVQPAAQVKAPSVSKAKASPKTKHTSPAGKAIRTKG